jgi:DNA-binding NarL/FixJ family response regulator
MPSGYDEIRWLTGIISMLSGEPDLVVVGEAEQGLESVDLCRQLRPDLMLLDVRMPEMDGIEAARILTASCPATSLLLLTTYAEPEYLRKGMRAGAKGYLLKDMSRDELLLGIRQVLRGQTAVNIGPAGMVLQRFVAATPR